MIKANWFERFTWLHEAIAQQKIYFRVGIREVLTLKNIILCIETVTGGSGK